MLLKCLQQLKVFRANGMTLVDKAVTGYDSEPQAQQPWAWAS